MLQSTRGLVFHVSRYSDSSGIVKIYTETHGLQSFVVKSLFSRNARIRPAMFGHLTLLDLVIDFKPNRALQYLKEVSINKPFHDINDHISKSTLLLFLNEVLYKSIREEETNEYLFEFIANSLQTLDEATYPVHSFHLLFLVQLSDFLGFGPSLSLVDDGDYFDMLNGQASHDKPTHSYFIHGESLAVLKKLTQMEYNDLENFNPRRAIRFELLDNLLDFFRIHLPEMSELKSVKILHEIMA